MDPGRVRELASQVRGHAETVDGKAPMAIPARDESRKGADESLALTRVQETLQALDGVLKFHASRFTGVADILDKAVTDFENQDQMRAARFTQEGPR
ncbi:hypothetical protein OHB12_01405 [Nocardia sp. NBC_01730]|uniref:hypothetical protein n=1 Tax=Nocardia sp. NBC_01730 TaxID=2975998 RepID=UPI002E111005|nr:hypothetical protein OHB12_01405 [Nocardia sp. NBC_01730]